MRLSLVLPCWLLLFVDAIAVASLDLGLVPPIANHKERDPCLGEVMLAQGGVHNRKYALRFGAGFGSQFAFLLFRKWSEQCLPACHGHSTTACSGALVGIETPDETNCECIGETDFGYETDPPHAKASALRTHNVQRYLLQRGHRDEGSHLNDIAEPLLEEEDRGEASLSDVSKPVHGPSQTDISHPSQHSFAAYTVAGDARDVARHEGDAAFLHSRMASADVQDSCNVM